MLPSAAPERWAGRSVEGRQASMSYFCQAPSGERGRPDQITESGSSGGMKSVSVDEGIS